MALQMQLPVVALVGYTNSGKSTLLNRLTAAGILAEDQLFATLDPTTRRLDMPSSTEVRACLACRTAALHSWAEQGRGQMVHAVSSQPQPSWQTFGCLGHSGPHHSAPRHA